MLTQAGQRARRSRALGLAGPDHSDAEAARRLVEGGAQLNRDLDVPGPRQYGIPEDRWRERIPVMAAQAKASGSPERNPRAPSVAEIAELYHALWH